MSAPTAAQPQRQVWVVEPARLAVWIVLATVIMLFAAFSSALLIRRTAADWLPIALPPVLWLNTALIVAASLTLERAKAAEGKRTVRWLLAAAVLSLLFLGGQLAAWQALVRQGVYVPTNPHSSFFYILTGLHGLHLLGGLAFLGWAAVRAVGGPALRQAVSIRESVSLCATYWHFLGGLWIYLFAVLSLA